MSMELMEAAGRGDVKRVKQLLSTDERIDSRDSLNQTALMWASKNDHLNVARFLVDAGAAVDARDLDGCTSLYLAATRGHLDVARLLVESGAAVNARARDGWMSLMQAASGGYFELVRFLIDKGAEVNATSNCGWTSLMRAAEYGHLNAVRILVERGAIVDDHGCDGQSSLSLTARGGHWDTMLFLLERGGYVNTRGINGQTLLMQAACDNRLDVVIYLVERGAAVNSQNRFGRTALMLAALGGHLNVVRFLVSHGAVADAVDNDGTTPLMLAAEEGHLEVVHLLLERGATVDTSSGGWNLLMLASTHGCLDVVRSLVKSGISVDACDSDGWTVLMLAADNGHLDVVRFLVKRGCVVDSRDNDGWTALMLACRGGHSDVVRFLVDHGANSNSTTRDGNSALSSASKFGRQEVVQFLLPFIQHRDRRPQFEHINGSLTRNFNIPSTWLIPPFEIEVEPFVNAKNIGGDYRGKWLEADVVVKLFVDDASSATFADEVRSWHQLRHPNVLKLYGVCTAGHRLFVCEYASNGSLPEYLKSCKAERQTPWKFLYEAALGLGYLHERKITHGNLRGSNILIGSDGLAKLSRFGLSASSSDGGWHISGALVRWAAPECLKGERISLASDVYSLGMCIIEAMSGKVPYDGQDESTVNVAMKYEGSGLIYMKDQLVTLADEQRELVEAMCRDKPPERLIMPAAVKKLEQLAMIEAVKLTQPTARQESHPVTTFVDFDALWGGSTSFLWSQVKSLVAQCKNTVYQQMWQEIVLIYLSLKTGRHLWSTMERFNDLLNECRQAFDSMSQQNRICRLSATRARDYSIQSLHRRIVQLLQLVRPQNYDAESRETEWKRLCREQVEIFVSEASKVCVLLSSVDSEEDRSALVAILKAELRNSDGKYTEKQLEVLQKTYDDIVSKSLEDSRLATTPEWFIPWFELEMNEMTTLGEGGFGCVFKTKWLDSEVVVKKLEIADKDEANADKKREMRQMFEREVDIWFGLSHPHVVRLFGACHVGRPFFVCELAPNGTLDEYLRRHPDELWVKLREAALGVQYLHARGVVHGDLKGNNILIGSDGKAKVTDFGLSGMFGDDSTEVLVSSALNWVAPECILGQKPTFASDVYSLGMCIIEALRVTNGDKYALPWGELPNEVVKSHAPRNILPLQPKNCTDAMWMLIERMCKRAPADRMQIMTVVDELGMLAGRQGDLNDEADQITSDIGKIYQSSSSVAASLAEMKIWIDKLDNAQDYDMNTLNMIYQLLWDRLEQVATQLFSVDDTTIVSETTISDFSTLVERSQMRTRAALGITGVIPLIKFIELALGGYALHRRLDKFMAAHAVSQDPSPVHDWTLACNTFMGVSNSPTAASSEEDVCVNEETGDKEEISATRDEAGIAETGDEAGKTETKNEAGIISSGEKHEEAIEVSCAMDGDCMPFISRLIALFSRRKT